MESEVRQALIAEGFTDDEIRLEETATGKVGGFLLSTQFEGRTQLDPEAKHQDPNQRHDVDFSLASDHAGQRA